MVRRPQERSEPHWGRLENNLSLMDPQEEKDSPDLRLIG
jgi:hypothetical protein